MLTQEVEGGRVQLRRRWPTAQQTFDALESIFYAQDLTDVHQLVSSMLAVSENLEGFIIVSNFQIHDRRMLELFDLDELFKFAPEWFANAWSHQGTASSRCTSQSSDAGYRV